MFSKIKRLWRDCKGPWVYWDLISWFVVTPLAFIYCCKIGSGPITENLFLALYAGGIFAGFFITLPAILIGAFLWSSNIFPSLMSFLIGFPVGVILHLFGIHVILWYLGYKGEKFFFVN